MPGPDPLLLAVPVTLAMSAGLFAYSLGPGVELIPYFLALVTWGGLAVAAVLLSPITALIRRLRRASGAPEVKAVEPTPRSVPGSPSKGPQ
jgi:hypothetical protein